MAKIKKPLSEGEFRHNTSIGANGEILYDCPIEIKDTAKNSLEDYKQTYGSDAYGFTAYVLNIIRIYSIPFGFLGITISAIYQYIIGIRHLENNEKGLVMMVSCITILVICQILPLAFAIVVKFGRG